MFLLGHLGLGLGLAWLATRKRTVDVDWRFLLLGTILPDLIDKPLGVVLDLEPRLWAHTLVFASVLCALSLAPHLRSLLWLAVGILTHFLFDAIWSQPWVILWPAYGWAFPPGGPTLEGYLYTLLHDPVVQAGEIIGAAVLVLFARAHGIVSWSALRAFLRNGRVAEPVPAT